MSEKKIKKLQKEFFSENSNMGALSTPVPVELKRTNRDFGFFFGNLSDDRYVGMPQGADGHIMIIGGSGSGKSSGLIKPTMTTWNGPFIALDIKGELSAHYKKFTQAMEGAEKAVRPFRVLDFMDAKSCYDPFWFLSHSCDEDLITNIMDLTKSFVPDNPEAKEPFWNESAQAMLTAQFLHHYINGCSFAGAVTKIAEGTLSGFLTEIGIHLHDDDDFDEDPDDGCVARCDPRVKMLVGQCLDIDRLLTYFDREIRNAVVCFAADARLMHVFRGKPNDPDLITWDDVGSHQIFLRVPDEKLDVWSPAVKLTISQLLRYLQSRPDKYSGLKSPPDPLLLLLDEFPRVGKIESILSALATLRSKAVNICMAIQSMAQLDLIYGANARRVILDNCAYKLILGASDPETQHELAEMIGKTIVLRRSVSAGFDELKRLQSYSITISEQTEFIFPPHLLSATDDVLLISPYGFSCLEKFKGYTQIVLFPSYEEDDVYISPIFRPLQLTTEKRKTKKGSKGA